MHGALVHGTSLGVRRRGSGPAPAERGRACHRHGGIGRAGHRRGGIEGAQLVGDAHVRRVRAGEVTLDLGVDRSREPIRRREVPAPREPAADHSDKSVFFCILILNK